MNNWIVWFLHWCAHSIHNFGAQHITHGTQAPQGISVFNYKSHPKLNTNKLIYDADADGVYVLRLRPNEWDYLGSVDTWVRCIRRRIDTLDAFVFHFAIQPKLIRTFTNMRRRVLHTLVALTETRRIVDNGQPPYDLLPMILPPYVPRCLAHGYRYIAPELIAWSESRVAQHILIININFFSSSVSACVRPRKGNWKWFIWCCLLFVDRGACEIRILLSSVGRKPAPANDDPKTLYTHLYHILLLSIRSFISFVGFSAPNNVCFSASKFMRRLTPLNMCTMWCMYVRV